jgi:uncharacterized membrane protein YraQ (UPF0718 family)
VTGGSASSFLRPNIDIFQYKRPAATTITILGTGCSTCQTLEANTETALAFMMAVVGLSLPEAMMLKKVMKTRLLATFFGAVAVSIVGLGYVFNWVL